MKLRKTLAGILGAVVMLLGVGTFEHVNKETGVKADDQLYFTKVSSGQTDWSGDYLIVYDAKSKAFDGSRNASNIDVDNNTIDVAISDDKIAYTPELGNKSFTITEESAGKYSIKSKGGAYIGRSASSNGMDEAATYTSSKHAHTISYANSTVSITSAGGPKLQTYISGINVRFRYYASSQKAISLYKLVGTVTECECSDFVEEENPSVTNKITDATCTESAVYKLVCSNCGKASENENDIYSYGDPLGHNYDELGLCTRCGIYNEDLSLDDRVTKLFVKYFNDGNYTKETYLNVNSTAMKEVGIYFHAEAIAPYRKTVYEPGKLSMVTANVEGEYDNDTLSIYENNSDVGNVKHTGLGGNWEVNWTSVEDKFVTLKDFKESTITGWTYENGIYSYTLTPATATTEDDMTRMAREFVAPMWLAPNADNYTYARFTKLTVEEDGAELVMKLFVNDVDASKLIDQSECLFSQARISKGTTNLATLATFEFGENGNGGTHVDGSTDSQTYSETNNGYTLSISGGSKMYAKSFDKMGNSCIKFGSGSAAGKFSFTAPEEVNKVIIYVSGYKGNTAKVKVNGTNYDIGVLSDNGEYFAIEVNTKETKSVNVESLNGGYRFMLNTIEFHS